METKELTKQDRKDIVDILNAYLCTGPRRTMEDVLEGIKRSHKLKPTAYKLLKRWGLEK